MKPLHVFSLIALATLFQLSALAQGQSISNFGSNPGNINAYKYIPANMPSDAPLVVVIHGCTQNAPNFSNQTGWNTLADRHKFYVAYAEQKSANNSTSCFNYWESGDNSRGQGEALSIKQVVDYMKSYYSIDDDKVFVTGLSAGGSMTVNMLSVYPDVFAAGAEMAGTPYRGAESSLEVTLIALGTISKSPQEWGDLVRNQYPNFTGAYPRLAIFHGTSDIIINYNNAKELVKQFTNLHGTNQNANNTDAAFEGNSRVLYEEFHNSNGEPVVVRYTIDNMAHGIAVDPGNCFKQGGTAGSNSIDVDFYSSFWAADFFGILQPPITIAGADSVNANQQGIVFTVPDNSGSTYNWQVPQDVTIVSGQGTNSLTVNWGNSNGTITVTETASTGCVFGPGELSVTAIPDTASTGIISSSISNEKILIRNSGQQTEFMVQTGTSQNLTIEIYNLNGRLIEQNDVQSNAYHPLPGSLARGVYIMKCKTAGGILLQKLVY